MKSVNDIDERLNNSLSNPHASEILRIHTLLGWIYDYVETAPNPLGKTRVKAVIKKLTSDCFSGSASIQESFTLAKKVLKDSN